MSAEPAPADAEGNEPPETNAPEGEQVATNTESTRRLSHPRSRGRATPSSPTVSHWSSGASQGGCGALVSGLLPTRSRTTPIGYEQYGAENCPLH